MKIERKIGNDNYEFELTPEELELAADSIKTEKKCNSRDIGRVLASLKPGEHIEVIFNG